MILTFSPGWQFAKGRSMTKKKKKAKTQKKPSIKGSKKRPSSSGKSTSGKSSSGKSSARKTRKTKAPLVSSKKGKKNSTQKKKTGTKNDPKRKKVKKVPKTTLKSSQVGKSKAKKSAAASKAAKKKTSKKKSSKKVALKKSPATKTVQKKSGSKKTPKKNTSGIKANQKKSGGNKSAKQTTAGKKTTAKNNAKQKAAKSNASATASSKRNANVKGKKKASLDQRPTSKSGKPGRNNENATKYDTTLKASNKNSKKIKSETSLIEKSLKSPSAKSSRSQKAEARVKSSKKSATSTSLSGNKSKPATPPQSKGKATSNVAVAAKSSIKSMADKITEAAVSVAKKVSDSTRTQSQSDGHSGDERNINGSTTNSHKLKARVGEETASATEKIASTIKAKMGKKVKVDSKSTEPAASGKTAPPVIKVEPKIIEAPVEEYRQEPRGDLFTDDEIDTYRDLLQVEKDKILTKARRAMEEGNIAIERDEMFDEVDQASAMTEQNLTFRLLDRDRKLLGEINHAIAKIDSGDYGYCEGTGEAIPKRRLELRPWTRHSVKYKEKLERMKKSGRGVVDEDEV